MRLTNSTLGSAALVAARRQAGLSQESLAAAAGLSVRAVRDLESGRVSRPRSATLKLLAEALELSHAAGTAFVEAWSTARRSVPFRELVASGYDIETMLALRDRNDVSEDLRFERHIIGAARRVIQVEHMIVCRALVDGPAGRLIVWGDDEVWAPGAVRIDRVSGGRCSDRVVLTELNLAVFEIDFPGSFEPGQQHVLGYRIRLEETPANLIDSAALTQDAIHGIRRPVGTLVIQVDFQSCRPPDDAWQFTIDRQRGNPVDVVGDCLQLIEQNAEPGFHGLGWAWHPD